MVVSILFIYVILNKYILYNIINLFSFFPYFKIIVHMWENLISLLVDIFYIALGSMTIYYLFYKTFAKYIFFQK